MSSPLNDLGCSMNWKVCDNYRLARFVNMGIKLAHKIDLATLVSRVNKCRTEMSKNN